MCGIDDDANAERDDDHYDGGYNGADVDDGGNMLVCVCAYITYGSGCVSFSEPRIARIPV